MIAILGRSVLKESAFVKEEAPGTGDTAEVIIMYQSNRGPGYTTVEEFGNGGFTLKSYQMFSIYTTPNGF